MKNFLLSALILVLILMTGCGTDDNTIKVGTIKYLNLTEETLDKILKGNPKLSDADRRHIFFDNINAMTAALQSGQIDEMSIYRTVALYLINNNPNHQWDMSEPIVSDVFCCAMRKEDIVLKKEFDEAILSLTRDGTLSKLVKTYIHEVSTADTPPAVELPTFYGAEMIRIGVTGDLPLLDYISADGMPSGFNTAVLAEISRRIGKNFVLVQVDSGARAIALTSGEVDVIFWAVVPEGDTLPADLDTPDGMILTEPYFSDGIVHVNLIK